MIAVPLPRDYAPPPLEVLGLWFGAAHERCMTETIQPTRDGYAPEWWGALTRRLHDACKEAPELEFGFVSGRPAAANENRPTPLFVLEKPATNEWIYVP